MTAHKLCVSSHGSCEVCWMGNYIKLLGNIQSVKTSTILSVLFLKLINHQHSSWEVKETWLVLKIIYVQWPHKHYISSISKQLNAQLKYVTVTGLN